MCFVYCSIRPFVTEPSLPVRFGPISRRRANIYMQFRDSDCLHPTRCDHARYTLQRSDRRIPNTIAQNGVLITYHRSTARLATRPWSEDCVGRRLVSAGQTGRRGPEGRWFLSGRTSRRSVWAEPRQTASLEPRRWPDELGYWSSFPRGATGERHHLGRPALL